MGSEEFVVAARKNPTDFTRRRSLPLPELMTFLLNLRKGANQDELDRFFEVASGQPVIQCITRSALCQARKKLEPRAFMALNDKLLEGFYRQFAAHRWHGLRLLAVDGSTARLPPTADVEAMFGPAPEGSSVPLARLSRLYDVLNHLVVEADVEPLSVSERIMAGEHLEATGEGDLLLYDRGYPAFWLFVLHQREQRHFCARLPANFCAASTAFARSDERSAVVTIRPGSDARAQCNLYGLPTGAIEVRLIKVTLPSGETEILATSLLDEVAYPTTWFKHLYHLRWGVEEAYKTEKCRVEIENFSGLTAQAVLQDIYAKIFMVNLSAMLAWVAQAIADRLYQTRKRAYQVNFANALSKMKDNVIRLFLGIGPATLLHDLVGAMALNVEAVRTDRSYPRRIRPTKLHGFHPNYRSQDKEFLISPEAQPHSTFTGSGVRQFSLAETQRRRDAGMQG